MTAQSLNAEVPCDENVAILAHLRDALRLYEARAARRTIEKLPMPERADICGICHHILCEHRKATRLEHAFKEQTRSEAEVQAREDRDNR